MDGQRVRAVYLHIGAPKTGTTFLQGLLWRNRGALEREGVALPGDGFSDHFRATQDLRGRSKEASSRTPSWAGEWEALARRARRARASRVVISCEMLAAADPEQARRAVAALEPAEVHVVYTARDLATLLPAAYQENVKHRYARDFDAWLADVIDSGAGPGRWFWRVHDSVEALRRWSSAVPSERVHVVTMPQGAREPAPRTAQRPQGEAGSPEGSAPDLLWRRFASLLDVPPDHVDASAARPNASLGRAEVELLRRLNAALDAGVPYWHYSTAVKDRLAHESLATRAGRERLALPAERFPWVRERAEGLVAGLRRAGYPVTGDLDELLPLVPDGDTADRPREVTDTEVLDAAVDGLAGLVEASLRERTELPARELLKRTLLELGGRARPLATTLGLYRRVAVRIRR